MYNYIIQKLQEKIIFEIPDQVNLALLGSSNSEATLIGLVIFQTDFLWILFTIISMSEMVILTVKF